MSNNWNDEEEEDEGPVCPCCWTDKTRNARIDGELRADVARLTAELDELRAACQKVLADINHCCGEDVTRGTLIAVLERTAEKINPNAGVAQPAPRGRWTP